jgi:hypothetical protein
VSPATTERVIRRRWNRPQSIFRRIRGSAESALIYIDLEGAVGSGKTTAPAWRLVEYATEFPGIFMAIGAWTDEMLGPPKNAFLAAARESGFSVDAGTLTWHGGQGEEYYEFEGYASRVYVRSLRASEEDMRYMKLAGLSLSILWIDQPEPVPKDVYDAYIPARMRQPGFPHEIWLSPNPLDDDHWLSREFPTVEAYAKPHHHYIHVSLRDNVANVGERFVLDMEAAHPPGSVTHNLQVAGHRGPSLKGVPVYKGYFDEDVHVDPRVRFDPRYPLLEGWDFGQEKPAVSWWQSLDHIGALRCLGSVKGESLFLEDFAPKVIEIRQRLFPTLRPNLNDGQAGVWTWCDPNGATNTTGSEQTAVSILRDYDVAAQFDGNANQAPIRSTAIQVIAGFMRRVAKDGTPAFLMHPRCIELVPNKYGDLEERETRLMVSAFKVGYVWSELAASDAHPNVRRPKKGTRYDDLMNTGEYVVIGVKVTVPQQQQMLMAEQRMRILGERAAMSHSSAVRAAELAELGRGPSGETLDEAMARRARILRSLPPDRDPADRGRQQVGRRGGY